MISGCSEPPIALDPKVEAPAPEIADYRAKQFRECMGLLPVGPSNSHYSDWDEVVAECRSEAYYETMTRYPGWR